MAEYLTDTYLNKITKEKVAIPTTPSYIGIHVGCMYTYLMNLIKTFIGINMKARGGGLGPS